MDKLITYDQGVFEIIEWHDVIFDGYGSAYVAISKCAGKNRLEEKQTQPPKGLTKQQVNDFIFDNWDVIDTRGEDKND